jgi:hypothetical protein
VEALNSFIVERRGRPRLAIACPARLRPNDWSTAQVEMLDISEEGFRAAGELLFRIGAYVSLQIAGIGWVDALIVWTHPGQFGARFLIPIDLTHCGWTAELEGRPCPAAFAGQEEARNENPNS